MDKIIPLRGVRKVVTKRYLSRLNRQPRFSVIRMWLAGWVQRAASTIAAWLEPSVGSLILFSDLNPTEKIAVGVAKGQHSVTEFALRGYGSHDDEKAVLVSSLSKKDQDSYYGPWEALARSGRIRDPMVVGSGPPSCILPDDCIMDWKTGRIVQLRGGTGSIIHNKGREWEELASKVSQSSGTSIAHWNFN